MTVPKLKDPLGTALIIVMTLIVIVTMMILVATVSAKTTGTKNDYASPDMDQYYATLPQPDNALSCCGEADVYWADDTDYGPNGQTIAIITDTRPDHRVLPNGLVIDRRHVDVGTRIVIPASKLRNPPLPNPTGHTIVFLGTNNDVVYCYEPQALM